MATETFPSHLQTRQQLDELDSLLQRMLALPSTSEPPFAISEPAQPEEFAPLPPALPMATIRQAVSEPHTALWRTHEPVSSNPPMAIAVEDAPAPRMAAPPAPYPYSMVYGQPLPSDTPPLAPWTPPSPRGAEIPLATPVGESELASMSEHSTSAFGLAVLVINRLFNLATYLMGPLGTWMRGVSGRNFLGWLGILMLVSAIGWVALEWYGVDWTRRSFSLR